MHKKVSIIIVSWNGLNFLKNCLKSLYKIDYPNFEVIIVDNGSFDNSIEYIKRNYPQVKLITNRRNVGFAEANNIGYKVADGKYILFLNNDTTVTKSFLTNLIKVIEEEKDLGGVQAKILTMSDKRRLDSAGSFLTNTGFLYHYGYNQLDSSRYNKRLFIYSAKGACMLFKKEVIEKCGIKYGKEVKIFDPDFFAYFEETDFCHRVWLSGYKIMYVPDSVIYHKIGGTSKRMDNSFIQYHSFKNRINSYIKNLGTKEFLKIFPLHILLCILVALVYVFRGKIKLFVAINASIIWNMINLPDTLRERSHVQNKIREIDDGSFFNIIKRNVNISYFYYLFARGLVGYKEKYE